jgi:hypothetical protein
MQTLKQKPLPESQAKIIRLLHEGYEGQFETSETSVDCLFNPVNRPFSRATLSKLEGGTYYIVKYQDVLALEKKGLVRVLHVGSEGVFKLAGDKA